MDKGWRFFETEQLWGVDFVSCWPVFAFELSFSLRGTLSKVSVVHFQNSKRSNLKEIA